MQALFCGLTDNYSIRVLNLMGNSASVRETFGMVVARLPHLNNHLEKLVLTSGGGSLINRNDTKETLLFLLQQLHWLGEGIRWQRLPRLYDLGTLLCSSCVNIDRHAASLETQRQLQQQFQEKIRLIQLYLDRNRFRSTGVLACEDPKMLPFSLSQTNRMSSTMDAVFYLLRRKVGCFLSVRS